MGRIDCGPAFCCGELNATVGRYGGGRAATQLWVGLQTISFIVEIVRDQKARVRCGAAQILYAHGGDTYVVADP